RDGGGWTLVLQNNAAVPSPTPSFAEVVSSVNLTGTLGADLSQFDLFLGVDYWNRLGTEIRMEAGATPGSPVQQVIYTFSIDAENDHALALGSGGITIGEVDTGFAPGGYHDGMGLSTYDVDNDASSEMSCSQLYGGLAWWYRSCWTESFWGLNANDSTDWGGIYPWGAMWVR